MQHRVARQRRLVDHGVALVVIAAALALAHGVRITTNWGQPHWEDQLFFQHEQTYIQHIGDCFRHPLWPGLYRPLSSTCYYYLVGQLTDQRIQAHHLINVLFYATNGLLLYHLCRRWMGRRWALLPGALFVSRYAHAEVVTNTVEFQVLLPTFFALLTVVFFLQGSDQSDNGWYGGWYGLAGVTFALALLSKETFVVLPAILWLERWLWRRNGSAAGIIGVSMVALGWGMLFALFLRGMAGQTATGFGYTLAPAEIIRNYTAYFLAFANLLTRAPDTLTMPANVLRLADAPAIQIGFCLLCVTAAGALIWLRQRPPGGYHSIRMVGFGLLFFLISAAPFVILVDRLFMRYAYWAHAGLAIAAGAALQALLQAAIPRRVATGGIAQTHDQLTG